MIWISFLFAALFKVFDELEQQSELNKWKTKWDWLNNWLNKEPGWKNKHNWRPTWLFSTAIVWVTDGEHFFQMLKHLCFAAAFAPLIGWSAILVMLFVMISSFVMNEIVLK